MQDVCGIADATGIHRPIDDLLLDLRGLASVGLRREKRPSTPQEALSAPVAVFAFRRRAVAYTLRPMAVGTEEDLRYHRGSLLYRWFCSAQTPQKDSISIALKRLPQWFACRPDAEAAVAAHSVLQSER